MFRLINSFPIAAAMLLMMAGFALAQPISIRNVNWSMSETEQVAALEREGLICLREPGWDSWWVPPTELDTELKRPNIQCFAQGVEGANIAALKRLYTEWEGTCRDAGTGAPACYDHEFKRLRDRLRMVEIRSDGVIVFECAFLRSCEYSAQDVISQLQRQVINAPFEKPTPDSWMVCATGSDGDKLCYHRGHTIWLVQNPDEGPMRF